MSPRRRKAATLARLPHAEALQKTRRCALVRSRNHRRLLDTGHFALEDKGGEIAAKMRDFLARKLH